MDKLKIALDIFGEEFVNEIAKQLKLADKEASGNLIRSLDYKLFRTNKGFSLRLLAANYYQYVDLGRKPGKMPPIQAISEWATIRGISQDAVWPIAVSIGLRGIKPANTTEKSIQAMTQSRRFREFEEDATDWVDDELDRLLEDIFINRSDKLGKVKLTF